MKQNESFEKKGDLDGCIVVFLAEEQRPIVSQEIQSLGGLFVGLTVQVSSDQGGQLRGVLAGGRHADGALE